MSDPSAASPAANPLRARLPRGQTIDPCAVVLFGATGDLTHRKLAPALFHLAREGNLPAAVSPSSASPAATGPTTRSATS